MALDRNAKYPGRYDAPTPEQPQGAFKNRTAAGSNDGSYLERDWLNDWSGFFSSVLDKVGFTPNGNVDEVGASQYFDAMELGRPVENLFKGNQNWNVAGSTGDPLPGGTPTLYTVGAEIVAGVEVITTNTDQITYVSGVLNSGNNTGILRRRYAKDAAGLITKSTQYGGIKLPDGSQLQALVDDIATNGVRITEDGSDVVVDVDLSVVTSGFRFFGLSDERGAWADINDEDSFLEFTGSNGFDFSTNGYQILESGLIIQWGENSIASSPQTINFPIPFVSTCFQVVPSSSSESSSSSHSIASSLTASSFQLNRSVSGTVRWIALGV